MMSIIVKGWTKNQSESKGCYIIKVEEDEEEDSSLCRRCHNVKRGEGR